MLDDYHKLVTIELKLMLRAIKGTPCLLNYLFPIDLDSLEGGNGGGDDGMSKRSRKSGGGGRRSSRLTRIPVTNEC